MKSIFLLLATCLSLSPATVLVESAPYTTNLGYTVELPDNYDSARAAYPLIVAIHGYGDHAGAYIGTAAQLCPEGAIGLYPESPFPFEDQGKIGWTWWLWADSASGMSQQSTKQQSIDWILSCIGRVKSKYRVDTNVVFLFGFSQGGMLTYEIGIRYPKLFRGLIPAGGLLDFKFDSLHQFDTLCRHLPLRALHGAYDSTVEFGADQASNETLRNRGMPAELLRYPAKHELTKEMMEDAHDFIASSLARHDSEWSDAINRMSRSWSGRPIPTRAEVSREQESPARDMTESSYDSDRVPNPLAYQTDTALAARDSLLYYLGSHRVTSGESLLTAVMKDRSAPSKLRQTAYSALIKLATPTAWQAVRTAQKVVCADRLVPDGNGEKAGLKPDDIIVSYNGKAVKKTSDLRDAIAAAKPDATDVAMVIERAGKRMTVRLPPGRVGVYLSERVK